MTIQILLTLSVLAVLLFCLHIALLAAKRIILGGTSWIDLAPVSGAAVIPLLALVVYFINGKLTDSSIVLLMVLVIPQIITIPVRIYGLTRG